MKTMNLLLVWCAVLLTACSQETQNPRIDFQTSALSVPVESTDLTSYDFGSSPKGQAVATKQFIFVKSAASPEAADSTIALESLDGAFVLTATQCNRELKKATDKCYAKITFTKKDFVGDYEASLKIGPVGSELVFSLSASVFDPTPTAQASLRAYIGSTLIAEPVSYGELTANKSAVQTISVKNEGSAAITLTSNLSSSPNFIKNSDTCSGVSLGINKVCYVKITFKADATAPEADEVRSASLVINDLEVELEGTLKGSPAVQALANVQVLEGTSERSEASPVVYGSVAQNSNTSKTLTIKNSGTGASGALNLAISGSSRLVLSNVNCGATLNAGASCFVKVILQAGSGQTVDEAVSGTLTALDKTVALEGNIIGVPAKVADVRLQDGVLDISTYDFGSLQGGVNVNKIFTVRNVGEAVTSGLSISVEGEGYSITANSCSASLGINKTCSVRVNLASGAAPLEDTSRDGNLFVDVANSDSLNISLTSVVLGSPPTAPDLRILSGAVEVDSFDMGSVELGKIAYKIFAVKNLGDAKSAVPSVSIEGEGFSIATNSCTAGLSPNIACNVRVNFSPVSASQEDEVKEGVLHVDGKTVALSVIVKADIPKVADLKFFSGTLEVSSHDFGDVSSNSSVNRIFTVKNVGTAASSVPIVGTDGGSYFSVMSHTCTAALGINKTCTVRVAFTSGSPSENTLRQGTIFVGDLQLHVAATELAPLLSDVKFYESSLEVMTVDFGIVNNVQKTSTRNLTLVNEGGGAVVGASTSLDPSSESGYIISVNTCSASLAPGASCIIRVVLSSVGQSNGQKNAVLSYGDASLNLAGEVNVAACSSSQHEEEGVCVANTRSCSPMPPNTMFGSQQWINGEWASCVATVCSPNHSVKDNVCTRTYNLSVTNPVGGSLLPSKAAPYFEGDIVTITATASEDYEFDSWTGDCASSGSSLVCELTMDSNKTLSAVFNAVGGCGAEEHDEGGSCVANVRNCAVVPPNSVTATETWSGGAWGSCVITCDTASGYSEMGSGPTRGCWTAVALSNSGDDVVTSGDSRTFSASGGRPPYTYSIVSSSLGSSIGSSSGVYVAGSEGSESVRVTDSLGQTDDISLTIEPVPENMRTLTITKNRPEGYLSIWSEYTGWQSVCQNQLSCQVTVPQGTGLYLQGDYYQNNGVFLVGFNNCPSSIPGDYICNVGWLNSNMTVGVIFTGPDINNPSSPYYSEVSSPLMHLRDSVTYYGFSYLRQGQQFLYQPLNLNPMYLRYTAENNNVSIHPDSSDAVITADSSLNQSWYYNWLSQLIPSVLKFVPESIGNFIVNIVGTTGGQPYNVDYKVKVFDSNEFGYGGLLDFHRIRYANYQQVYSTISDYPFLSFFPDGRFFMSYPSDWGSAITLFSSKGEKENNYNLEGGHLSRSRFLRHQSTYVPGYQGYFMANQMTASTVVDNKLHVFTGFDVKNPSHPTGEGFELAMFKVNEDGTNTFGDVLTAQSSIDYVTKGKLLQIKEAGKTAFFYNAYPKSDGFLVLAQIVGGGTQTSRLFKVKYDTGDLDTSFATTSEDLGFVSSNVSGNKKEICFEDGGNCHAAYALLSSKNSSKSYAVGFVPKIMDVSGSNYSYNEMQIMKLDANGNFDSSYSNVYKNLDSYDQNVTKNLFMPLTEGTTILDGEELFFTEYQREAPTPHGGGGVIIGNGVYRITKIGPTGVKDTNFDLAYDYMEFQCEGYPHMFHVDSNYVYFGYRKTPEYQDPEFGQAYCSVFTIGRFNKHTGVIDSSYGQDTQVYLYNVNGWTMYSQNDIRYYAELRKIQVEGSKVFAIFDNFVAKLDLATGDVDAADPKSHIICSGGAEGSWNTELEQCVCEAGAVIYKGVCEPREKYLCENANFSGMGGGYPSWDDYNRTCSCPEAQVYIGWTNYGVPAYLNYDTGNCEVPELNCGEGYWSGERCECPSGYDEEQSLYGCRVSDNYKTCVNSGGFWADWEWQGNECQCPDGYVSDGMYGCQESPEYQDCMADGNAWWDSGTNYCVCNDWSHQWQWSDSLGRMACFSQGEEDCSNNGGTWEWGGCNYGCGNYWDEMSCNDVGGGGYCWWDPQWNDCSNIWDEWECMDYGMYGCYWDEGMMGCSGGYYPDPNSGMCNSNY